MAYIWEDYDKDKTYIINDISSPYMEVLTEMEVESVCSVNPLIRFAEIFGSVDIMQEASELDFKKNENIIFHFLALLDLARGLDKQQVQLDYLELLIRKGYFGVSICNRYNDLEKNKKLVLVEALLKHLQAKTQDDGCFIWAVTRFFEKNSLIYEESTDRYYLYISSSASEKNRSELNLLIDLFWNFQLKLEIVWQYHYGVIGTEATMRLNEIWIL